MSSGPVREVGAGIAATAAIALLAGCAPDAVEFSGPDVARSSVAPTFEGPWAAEFTEAYTRATTDFERLVLEDERVTDQELGEMRDVFTECLAAFGFFNIKFSPDGGFEYEVPSGTDMDTSRADAMACSDSAGESTIGALHSWVRRNPENLDDDTIIAACLVRKGAVDSSYSAADFAADEEDLSIPYLPGFGDASFAECNSDPLGLFE